MRKAMAAAVIAALALTGCGGSSDQADDAPSASAEPSRSAKPSPTQEMTDDATDEATGSGDGDDDGIEIEIEGDRIEPNGKRVQVDAGAPVRLEIESDRAGELHVHTSPDQEIAFEKGESVVKVSIDTPGIVDVEEHESGTVILQLEVR